MVWFVLGWVMSVAFAGEPTLVGKSKVTFEAEGQPGFLTFEGVTNDLTLAQEGEQWVFTVPMATVDTGIALRDDHMRDNYVEVGTYPNVVLRLDPSTLSWPESGKSAGTIEATFEAHGVTLPVTVEYTLKAGKESTRVQAKFPFNTEAHKIEIPTYMGITIKPEMLAKVTLEVTR